MGKTWRRSIALVGGLVAAVALSAALTACDPAGYTLTMGSSTPGPVAIGSTVTFSGKLAPARSGGKVAIERWVNNAWTGVGSTTLSSSSRYSVPLKLSYRTTYRLRARWVSPSGAAAASPSKSITVADRPTAPRAVTATRSDSDRASGGSVLVSWQWQDTSDYDRGATVTSFTVWADGGASVPALWFNVAGTGRSMLVNGLQNGTRYTFHVYAVNLAGDGPRASATATPASMPKAPTGLSAAEGDHQAPLTFTRPNDGGAPITNYEIKSPQGFVGVILNGGVSQSATAMATGLTNGSAYTFQLRACNEVGCGPWSSSSNAVTPFGDPAAPSVSSSVADRTITWTWSPPDGNGRPVDHYEIRLDGALVDANATSTSLARTFGSGETHTLSVTAVNTGGRKSPTGSSSATTAGPPRSVSLAKGASAVGHTDGTGTCTHSSCAFLRVTLNGFASGSHSVQCWADAGGASAFYSYSTSATTSEVCWFGYPSYQAWAVVDGVESNHVTW